MSYPGLEARTVFSIKSKIESLESRSLVGSGTPRSLGGTTIAVTGVSWSQKMWKRLLGGKTNSKSSRAIEVVILSAGSGREG